MCWDNISKDITFQGEFAAFTCFIHLLTPTAYEQALHEWLEMVPVNKIYGFGGDYCHIEGIYGGLRMVQECIARVLAEKVKNGYFSRQEALSVAGRILYDNAKEAYKL